MAVERGLSGFRDWWGRFPRLGVESPPREVLGLFSVVARGKELEGRGTTLGFAARHERADRGAQRGRRGHGLTPLPLIARSFRTSWLFRTTRSFGKCGVKREPMRVFLPLVDLSSHPGILFGSWPFSCRAVDRIRSESVQGDLDLNSIPMEDVRGRGVFAARR